MSIIYLDNCATTRPFPEVIEQMVQTMEEGYANPSSMYDAGLESEKKLRQARENVMRLIGARQGRIVFTSGGTEGNNLAIQGALAARRNVSHIIVGSTEHPSVLRVAEEYKRRGTEVTFLPVDEYGRAQPETLAQAMREDTALVSIMHVNNENGAVNDIDALARTAKAAAPGCVFHSDGVQATGRVFARSIGSGIDLYTSSGHKIHAPKGVGSLFISDKVRVKPIVFGGGQEENLRSGTENTPGIAGFSCAARLFYEHREEYLEKLSSLRELLMQLIAQNIEDVHFNCPPEGAAPHIISVSFPGVRSEVLLHTLEGEGIMVSSGSACSSRKKAVSHVLSAMNVPDKIAQSTIRMCVSPINTTQEIERASEVLAACVPRLRRVMRR